MIRSRVYSSRYWIQNNQHTIRVIQTLDQLQCMLEWSEIQHNAWQNIEHELISDQYMSTIILTQEQLEHLIHYSLSLGDSPWESIMVL